LLGGRSCILIGDWGQLPPVMDLPLYSTAAKSELSDLGSANYNMFDSVVVLDHVMRQAGNGDAQQQFRDLLMRLRNGQSTIDDWKNLMQQTLTNVRDTSVFDNALHLFPTAMAVAEFNVTKLHSNGEPVAIMNAVHSGPGASKASAEDAGGLESVVCLAHGARVMLTANLWVDAGLVNGAMGTVVGICYDNDESPPSLPLAVTVKFDSYAGPTLSDGTVPITPLRRSWLSTDKQSSRLQLPLKLAWAVTIHKCQGMTLDKVVIDVGKKEFSTGLTFVACSRVRSLKDMVFVPPFSFQRISNISNSRRLNERICEDARLHRMSKKEKCYVCIDLTTTCFVVKQDIIENSQVPAEKQANKPISSKQDQHNNSSDGSTIQPSEEADKGSSELANVPIEQAQSNDTDDLIIVRTESNYRFRYHPVNDDWQRRVCAELHLNYIASNEITPGGCFF